MLRKTLIFIPLVFFMIMGALSLLAPGVISDVLGVSPDNPVGSGTVRGDFAALFLTGGIACALALFRGRTHYLWVPISLIGITFMGRLVEGIVSGFGRGVAQTMIIELIIVVMLAFAMRLDRSHV